MYVYLIQAPHGVKVGVSVRPQKRIRDIETQGGFSTLRTWISEPARNAFSVESAAHAALRDSRLVGEWFGCAFEVALSAIHAAMASQPANWREAARFEAFNRGVTIREISEQMRVTPGAVGHWLSGRRTASVEEAQQIAEAIGVTLCDLLIDPKTRAQRIDS